MVEPLNVEAAQDTKGRWYVEFPLDNGTFGWLRCKDEVAAKCLVKAMQECVK